jgi:carbamoyl-phosphate synthase small subunit
LVLEDGTAFTGSSFGADGEAFGEAVFNTGMAGYQEVLTDPSYARQIVAMTSPQQGNHGINPIDPESERVRVAGFAVREASRRASSWRAEGTLREGLVDAGVVGIEGIDTRRLTRRLREHGAMRAAISTTDLDPASLVERVRRSPGMQGADLARDVSVDEPYEAASLVGPASTASGRVFRVAAYDLGIKRNILRLLASCGIEATVFPATTPATDVLAAGSDGVLLSNGPGDPAVTGYGIEAAKDLLGKVPMFGICLGHQLLALALGGRTYKMAFGHRGVNQPVRDLRTGRVEITSHNHGFAVDPSAWPGGVDASSPADAAEPRADDPSAATNPSVPDARCAAAGKEARGSAGMPLVSTGLGRVELTHWNLNDGTLEGLRCLDVAAFSVQYHPEAAPGPHDSRHLFDEFRALMERAG